MDRGDAAALAGLLLLYIVSRGLVFWAGARFDLAPLDEAWQILDPALLRHDLIASLAHMVGQPPLYNLLLGVVLKLAALFGGGHAITIVLMRLLYGALGLAAIALFYQLLRYARLARGRAFIIVGLFACSPAFLLYELIPYYTLMVLAGLLLVVWCFARAQTGWSFGRASALFFAMTALIYTRSLFQVEWFLVLALFCIAVARGHRRAVMLAALAPLALILALYTKNVVLIGQFSTSDWLGMSLAKMTTLKLAPDRRAELVASGKLSPLAASGKAFDLPRDQLASLGGAPHTGYAVLDDLKKSTGATNYNYRLFARVGELAKQDAVTTIRLSPQTYLSSVGTAWLMFWRPASDYPFLADNRQAIDIWSRLYGCVIAGQPVYPAKPAFALELGHIGLFLVAGYLLAVGFGLIVIARCVRRRRLSPLDSLLLMAWLNVMYVSVVGNALEIDENQRFRFAITPMILLLDAVALRGFFQRWRPRRYAPAPVHESGA